MVEQACIDQMKNCWVAGYLICRGFSTGLHGHALCDESFPAVMLDCYQLQDEGHINIPLVNGFQGAYDGVRYLAGIGSRRIALVAGHEELLFHRGRMRGYAQSLCSSLLFDEALVMRGTGSLESFYGMAQALMRTDAPPDAVFAVSDTRAFVVMHALHDLGRGNPAAGFRAWLWQCKMGLLGGTAAFHSGAAIV